MKRRLLLAAAFLLALAPAASAYNVKLKDGTIIFARVRYEVKGDKAIITLQNGTVTQIALDRVDIPGTEQYNKENPGNVIAINPGSESAPKAIPTPVPSVSLQEIIRKKNVRFQSPESKSAAGDAPGSSSSSWQAVEPLVDDAFRKVLDGAGIAQYKLTNYRGKLRLLATTNTEEAVFHTLSAAARALADLGNRDKEMAVEIVLTTSSGGSGGSFEMTTEQGRQLVNGSVAVADYFIRNVIL